MYDFRACKQRVMYVSASIMWEDGISVEISLTFAQSVTLNSDKLLGFLLILVVFISGKAQAEGGSARTSLLILVSIFTSAAFLMFLVYKNFPQLSE